MTVLDGRAGPAPIPWIAIFGIGTVLYCVIGVIYRLYFSPLAKFPGPKLAAATLWYEAYYDVVKGGQYTFKIKKLHEKYGPIIRISPHELHINDPDYHETLYSLRSPRDKYPYFTKQFGIPKSTFNTVSHSLHRLRRQPQNPFFSKASIMRLEPVISSSIEQFCRRIVEFKDKKEPMPIQLAFRCLTTDIISLYAMNKSWNYVGSDDWSPRWFSTIKATADMGHVMKQFPFLLPVFQALPEWAVVKLWPSMILILDWHKSLASDIRHIMSQLEQKVEKQEGELPRTIFQTLLESDLPAEEKTVDRLWQEALLIIGAGTDTTGNTLAVTTFHILNNPNVLKKLKVELATAMPDAFEPAKLSVVEHLPYLHACIQEGLRFAYGPATRLARIAPNEVMQYAEYSIPAGTPVGMTSVLTHHNESIFPDSYTYIPERWTGPDGGRSLEKYMVSFSRGSRGCIGINLAKAELYLVLATIFRRYDMELFDINRERDIDLFYDGFLPQPNPESKGVRVLFK